ncbi:MAG: sulfite exporter TauE/SafE family protein [Verrucomicrobiales bacterium]|nr:sulfite exporter TauE/SafE family protein [Verrucomicrobiales bacterium]
MSPWEALGLAAAAATAGAINAVAGGGTLVTFPSLLAVGTPPVVANATSTLALMIGTSGSILGFRSHLGPVRPWLRRFIPVSLVGGLLGGVLLTLTTDRVFSRLIPFLLLFATLLFLAQGAVARLKDADAGGGGGTGSAEPRHLGVILVFQFLVAVYGGYFGAGIGILMLASLAYMGLTNIHEMNTVKTVVGSLINLVATVWFVGAGLIDWPKAAVMTVGAVTGYYLGSRFSQRISQRRVRQIITVIGFLISGYSFYVEFFN